GRRTITHQEFDQSFTGVVLAFEPGPEFQPGGQPRSIVSALIKSARGFNVPIYFVLVVSVLLIVPKLLVPVLTGVFVDDVIIDRYEHWLRPVILAMLTAAAFQAAVSWLQQRHILRLRLALANERSTQFLSHLLRLPMAFYNQRSVGDIQSRMQSNDRLASTLAQDLVRASVGLVTIVLFTLMMFAYSEPLALVALSATIINLAVAMLITKRTRTAGQLLSIHQGEKNGIAFSGLGAIESIKAAGNEGNIFERWANSQSLVLNAQFESGRINALLGLIPELVVTLSLGAALVLGGYLVIAGQLTVGQLVAFQVLLAGLFMPTRDLITFANQVQALVGDIDRLDDVLRNTPDARVADVSQDREKPYIRVRGELELSELSYGFSRTAAPLISNFNLRMQPGGRAAVVGPSGCGKSTVARLIAGIHEPWHGQIKIDGKSTDSWARNQLASDLAVVDQDPRFFTGTIRDNLSMWDASVSEDDLIAAAKDACILDVILQRGGFDSEVSEAGKNFSGGQRQRLEIARALALNPRILVLDEATSALDVETEKQVDRNIRRRGCTTIVIAHRLSTIRDADEILVMNLGVIVERGSHDELMTGSKGFYRNLVEQG
ncbi:MAG: ABC transporter transmembrane domain-containing protein, partial [Pseudomonadota bacterium]